MSTVDTSQINQSPSKESKKKSNANLRRRDAIETLIAKPPMIVTSAISQLRYLILAEGLTINKDGQCSYRNYVWSILLRVGPVKSTSYLHLIQKGPSSSYSKIRNDTFRTLTTDSNFRAKVSEESLIRILNAFSWKQQYSSGVNTLAAQRKPSFSDIYVQGMNVLAAPFLYVCKSEYQAFNLFDTFLTRDCPLYIQPTLQGVHLGLTLLDVSLSIIDPNLYEFLRSKYLSAELYAFPSILTFSACTPPLTEVLILWDFLFAYGCHMNILFVIAQLTLIREKLMSSSSPMSLLRAFPSLQAREVIKLGISYVAKLPDNVYDLLVRHTYDTGAAVEVNKLAETMKKRKNKLTKA